MYTVNNFENNTTLLYQGGSGGFFFYFLLLLSGRFISGDPLFLENKDVVELTKQRILQQYPSLLNTQRSSWKSFEYWPDNTLCRNIDSNKQKLFLICNPTFNRTLIKDHLMLSKDTDIVLFYTDLRTQMRMAYEKNAYWFTTVSRQKFNAPDNNFKYIRKILKDSTTIGDCKVEKEIVNLTAIFKPKYSISLKDVLRSFDTFNADQQWFINHWLDLQSNKTKRLLSEI